MKVSTDIFELFIILSLLTCCSQRENGTSNYYFDPDAGTDRGPGTSPEQAFRSLDALQSISLKPGDRVLLKSGSLFKDKLFVSCKGSQDKAIVIGKYGGNDRPHICGDNTSLSAVHVFNSEYLEIRDLEISNKRDSAIRNLNGLFVELKDYGEAMNIRVENLFIHDVHGSLLKEEGGGTAILFQNFNDNDTLSKSSHFNGLVIGNCHIKDCQRNGIIIWGNWIRRKWDPNLNVVIRNNLIEGVPGDGIMPSACKSPLVEYNIMRDCPATLPASEACDGIWPWSCDNAVIQFNIVSDHKSHVDAYGFDSDWNSTNSIFQYNLSFNNDGGFILVCNPGGWTADWSLGNRGTVVRYNISINDGMRDFIQKNKTGYFSPVIHLTGPVSNTLIENNIFYLFDKPNPQTDRTLISYTDWSGFPDSTVFKNNYIFVSEPYKTADLNNSSQNIFQNNHFEGSLINPPEGFIEYKGKFNKELWYNQVDINWKRLVDFVRDKTVTVNGMEVPVLKIIGFYD